MQYRCWQNDTDRIRYQTIKLFPFGLLVYSAYSIIVFRDNNFPNDVKMKNNIHLSLKKKKKSFIFVEN